MSATISPPPKSQHSGELDNLLHQTQEVYSRERAKRLRPEGNAQYIDTASSDKYARFGQDLWNDPHVRDNSALLEPTSTRHHRILIVGAGFGGLLFAVRFLQAGFSLDEIVLVDSAGGFGGTWYWNRYPGLMCDVESYIYLPLLEETGYIPRQKYASGTEVRHHADRIARQWGLDRRAVFRTIAKEMAWDEDGKNWIVDLARGKSNEKAVTVTADFIVLAPGLLSIPKLPDVSGIDQFEGSIFHTSRWDYGCTAGAPEDASMAKLKDKKVAIIGTGATAVQVIPHLARWAKQLYVVQRTPSGVDRRDNHPTDPDWWTDEVVSQGKGWQQARMENFNAFVTDMSPKSFVNLVDDRWSQFPSYSGLVGGPQNLNPDYVDHLNAIDLIRQERIRQRVDDIVRNKQTAAQLKPWYPGWCKRPCFHDEYLDTFNRENVTLVDTDGKGIDRLTSKGVMVGQTEYNADIIIFSTGFDLSGRVGPAGYANMAITGREGKSMHQKWDEGIATLHGVISHDFPNLFYPGPNQAGAAPNQIYVLDRLSTHVAYIISEAVRRASTASQKVVIEPTREAEEAWSREVLVRAQGFSGIAGCTPSYFNNEGKFSVITSAEDALKVGRMSVWGEGIAEYVKVIEVWRQRRDLAGLDVVVHS